MLDSWCSLESTQYKRWLSKSWGGGIRLDTSYCSCLSTALHSSLHIFPGLREQRHWPPRGDSDTRPMGLLTVVRIISSRLPTHTDKQGSPRVIPLGHSMLSETNVCRSAPLSPAFSILAWKPQSDQYMNLKDRRAQISFLFGIAGVV